VENGIGVFGTLIQELHGFFRWEDEQCEFPASVRDAI